MRTTGFQKPFSRDQAASWVIQVAFISSFVAFVATLLSREKYLAILLPNAVLVTIVLWSWSVCESRDPSKPIPPTAWLPSILRVPHKESRYCGLCYKNSPGLDHHCTWLNTCIAESNYESFYCLVVAATCQTVLQAVIGVLMCTLWENEVRFNAAGGCENAVIALLWIHNAACISLSNSFFLLAGFHTYLLCVGMGTYDFILANGSDGLCTRLLKCNCLRRLKPKTQKCSHVQLGNAKGAKISAARSRRGTPPTIVVPSAPSAVPMQTPLEHAAAVAVALELSRSNEQTAASKVQEITSPAITNPAEVIGNSATASVQPVMVNMSVHESEGVFEDVDLGPSPSKPVKKSPSAVMPASSES